MPIEVPRPGKLIRVRFIRDVCYAGRDYGPSYPEQVADVQEDWAAFFVCAGYAVRVEQQPAEAERPAKPGRKASA